MGVAPLHGPLPPSLSTVPEPTVRTPTEHVDVVVVGGGIAGVATAHFVATAGASVVLLDREPVLAHHTTGRSAAQYLENYGAEEVRRLALASRPFFEDPPEGLMEASLLSPRPMLEVGGPDAADRAREHAARGAALVPSIRLLDAAGAVARCPVLRPECIGAAVLEPDSMDIDVMALHQGFVRGLRQGAGQVRTGEPVVGLEGTGDGWIVRTPTAVIAARVVVNAAGAWGDELARLAGVAPVGLAPLRRSAFTVSLPAGLDARDWPLVHDLDGGWYFKPEGDGLLCSLADETLEEPRDTRPLEEDVALAIDRINAATTLGLRHVRTAWAGQRTFAADQIPVVGQAPDAPGFVWVVGLGGFGIMTAPAVGRLAAAAVLGEPLDEDMAALGIDPAAYGAARFQVA